MTVAQLDVLGTAYLTRSKIIILEHMIRKKEKEITL